MKRSAYWTVGLLTALLIGAIGAGTAQAKLAVATFVLPLRGSEEVPVNVHGNADRGSVTMTVVSTTGTVCLKFGTLTLTAGEPLPAMAHIHRAPVGVAGPIVLHLFGTSGITTPTGYPTKKACLTTSDTALLDEIIQHPERFYMNLHNPPTHGSGVVRGQLKPLKQSIFDLINSSTTPN